ncbi:PadR family transcriptional regulator [Candidatus Solincola sp.]|nr:PadR family transcriptional regulator [Actinomycetota bacterium]MDI7252701.1 PadR family transcriptional regulator [Actinomycetota bacterium]
MAGSKLKQVDILADINAYIREGPGKRFIEPRILFLLNRGPAHGYQLMRKMDEVPLPGPLPDVGAVYRRLRRMEEEGLVTSRWTSAERGPQRKVYRLTPKGRKRLALWVEAIRARVTLLQRFLELCDEGV